MIYRRSALELEHSTSRFLFKILLVFRWEDEKWWIRNDGDFLLFIEGCNFSCFQLGISFLGPCTIVENIKLMMNLRFLKMKSLKLMTYSFSSFSLFSNSSLSAVPLRMAKAKASLSRCFCNSASARSFSASSAWKFIYLVNIYFNNCG